MGSMVGVAEGWIAVTGVAVAASAGVLSGVYGPLVGTGVSAGDRTKRACTFSEPATVSRSCSLVDEDAARPGEETRHRRNVHREGSAGRSLSCTVAPEGRSSFLFGVVTVRCSATLPARIVSVTIPAATFPSAVMETKSDEGEATRAASAWSGRDNERLSAVVPGPDSRDGITSATSTKRRRFTLPPFAVPIAWPMLACCRKK